MSSNINTNINSSGASISVPGILLPWIWTCRVMTTTYYHVRIVRRPSTTRRWPRAAATVWTVDWETREVHAYLLHDMSTLLRLNVRYGGRAWAVRDPLPHE
jgi:hypothetical protein